MENEAKKPPPVVLSFIVADDVSIDGTSRKCSIFGLFDDVYSNVFPAMHPRLAVFIELTNGHGACPLTLKLVDANTDDEIIKGGMEVSFENPFMVARLNLQFNGIVFPRAGEYRFQLFADNELVIERRVFAKPPPGSEGESDASA